MKDPEDKHHWIVDPEAAAVVKRIFQMCMEGRGPSQIANQLTADKVLDPTAYKHRLGINTPSPAPEDPYCWDANSVVRILERREYTGCTVNFKTFTNSIWDKKKRENPIEKQAIFAGAHEAIIGEDVFERVQEIREHRHRKTRTGISSPFSGLVWISKQTKKKPGWRTNPADRSPYWNTRRYVRAWLYCCTR